MRAFVQRLEDRRLLSAGALDAHFGSAGIVTRDFGTSPVIPEDLAIQRGGRTLVLAAVGQPGMGDWTQMLLRYGGRRIGR